MEAIPEDAESEMSFVAPGEESDDDSSKRTTQTSASSGYFTISLSDATTVTSGKTWSKLKPYAMTEKYA